MRKRCHGGADLYKHVNMPVDDPLLMQRQIHGPFNESCREQGSSDKKEDESAETQTSVLIRSSLLCQHQYLLILQIINYVLFFSDPAFNVIKSGTCRKQAFLNVLNLQFSRKDGLS